MGKSEPVRGGRWLEIRGREKRRDSVFVITGNKGFFLAGIYESTGYGVHRTIMDLECVTHG